MENVCPKDIYEKYRNEYGREKNKAQSPEYLFIFFCFFPPLPDKQDQKRK